jgi:hypothetical protein
MPLTHFRHYASPKVKWQLLSKQQVLTTGVSDRRDAVVPTAAPSPDCTICCGEQQVAEADDHKQLQGGILSPQVPATQLASHG